MTAVTKATKKKKNKPTQHNWTNNKSIYTYIDDLCGSVERTFTLENA